MPRSELFAFAFDHRNQFFELAQAAGAQLTDTEDDVKRALDRFFPEDGSVPAEVRDEPVSARELTADD